jgi:hypothetical protein
LKINRFVVVVGLAMAACTGDSRTPVLPSLPAAKAPNGSGALGNQLGIPIDGKGICAGKPTWKSVNGDVTYCVTQTDLDLQGNLCHFVKSDGPRLLRHRIGVQTGAAGASIKVPVSFAAFENHCGAGGPLLDTPPAKGTLVIEGAEADGGMSFPPNTEKEITLVYDIGVQHCGRTQSVADLLTQNGTSLDVGNFVMNYPEPCKCETLFEGVRLLEGFILIPGDAPADQTSRVGANAQKLHSAFLAARRKSRDVAAPPKEAASIDDVAFKIFPPITVSPGWSLTFDAATPETEDAPNMAAGFFCSDGTFAIDLTDGTFPIHLVQPLPNGAECTAILETLVRKQTYFKITTCPGLAEPEGGCLQCGGDTRK